MGQQVEKKRELLNDLTKIMNEVMALSEYASKLEHGDNFQAVKKLRMGLLDLRIRSIPDFEKKISGIRAEIIEKRANK